MFETQAMIESLDAPGTVTIVHECKPVNPNHVVANYNGINYTAIYNPFSGLYYVGDKYQKLADQSVCPFCGDTLPEVS